MCICRMYHAVCLADGQNVVFFEKKKERCFRLPLKISIFASRKVLKQQIIITKHQQ